MAEIARIVGNGFVMPAQAGIHLRFHGKVKKTWIPAYAGMTEEAVDR